MLNGQTFSGRTGKTSGLPELNYPFDTQIAGGIGAALFGNALLKMGKAKSARKA